jgi:hypothetical protein
MRDLFSDIGEGKHISINGGELAVVGFKVDDIHELSSDYLSHGG